MKSREKQKEANASSVTGFLVVVAVVIIFIVVWDKIIGANVFISRILLSIFRLLSMLF